MKRWSVLKPIAEKERIGGAQVTAMERFRQRSWRISIGTEKNTRPSRSQSREVASLLGDIAIGPDNKPSVHAYAVLGKRSGAAVAGHLEKAHVRPTLEIIITGKPAHLCKAKDKETGLAD